MRLQWKHRAIKKPFSRQLPVQQRGNEQGSAEELPLSGHLLLPPRKQILSKIHFRWTAARCLTDDEAPLVSLTEVGLKKKHAT